MSGNRRRLSLREELGGYLYILPLLAVLAFLDFYPIAYSILISFSNLDYLNILKPLQIVGLRNYYTIVASGMLWKLLYQTTIWSLGSVAIMGPLGFVIALVINQRGLKGKTAYRTAILVPWAFPAFITILVWQGMLNLNYGIVNRMLNLIGIGSVNWLGTPGNAMLSMILVNVWLSFPYYTFVYTSAMQSLPAELLDAAEMDGYGIFGRLRRIIIPMLSRQIAFITIFGFIFTWNNFYIPFLLTSGGPGTSTQILITYSYVSAFDYYNYGIAAAYAVISIIILVIFVVVVNKMTKMMSVLY